MAAVAGPGPGHHLGSHAHSCLFLSPKIRYSAEDCTFTEEMDCLGYNQYKSPKHHLHIILIRSKYRQQLQNKGPSKFIPMFPRSFLEAGRDQLESKLFSLPLDPDSMDPFGMVEDMEMKSPSFQK